MNASTGPANRSTPIVTIPGFPRMGARRELKFALERHWRGEIDGAALQVVASELRQRHWQLQHEAGLDLLPCNDFSLYDHMLDTAVLFDAIPDSHRALFEADPLAGYFALARGHQRDGLDLPALEMTKWFDSNYHYLVPQLHAGSQFRLRENQPLKHWHQARAAGFNARPVLPGPVTFLLLSKTVDGSDPLALLDRLLPAYVELLAQLQAAGVEWVSLDEPSLGCDLSAAAQQAFREAYATLAHAKSPKILLNAAMGGLGDNLALATDLPCAALQIDLVRAPGELYEVLRRLPAGRVLVLGLIDGRNIWRADLDVALALARHAATERAPHSLWLSSATSLLHVPLDTALEIQLDPELHSWLAFAVQKMQELRLLADALAEQPDAVSRLAAARQLKMARQHSGRIHHPAVRERVQTLDLNASVRREDATTRRQVQQQAFGLPLFPTTTIGSFPQTDAVRVARGRWQRGELDQVQYDAFLADATAQAVRWQEEIGIDVLVHGEFERNDMVEYFSSQLDGFAATAHGWVQSYGSRCVKPPLIYGDVQRLQPLTVQWSRYAQTLTRRPVKGMLTGPVTMLQWSFVRDDQPRQATCTQLALALRDEVLDLEAAGIRIIQIDEPALREGLPLRRAHWASYLQWTVDCFRLTAGGVAAATQIHTHMCYAQFNDIIEAVAALDADVISIETSRSRMELLDAFADYRYPNAIGPGVYDIHSPRVPAHGDMLALLDRALAVLRPEQLWVNPDCGLKTRGWAETRPALVAMVEAARVLRARYRQVAA